MASDPSARALSRPPAKPEGAARASEPGSSAETIDQVVVALSDCSDDALSRAACEGLPDRLEAVDWVERTKRLILYQRDASALRSEVPALADRLRRLLGQLALPEGLSADTVVERFVARLPVLRSALAQDVEAAMEGDPAAKSFAEIVAAYPAIRAIAIYRIAHELHCQGVPLLPRVLTEHGHDRTGIDIHPGAQVGHHFFVDHGTGVVVGETARIGNHVKLYQGVTLGALSPRHGESLRGVKRHPTLEDHVTVYSGTTILGGDTVIGCGSVIGGNVWLTESVPTGSKVVAEPARQMVRRRSEEADLTPCTMQLHWDI